MSVEIEVIEHGSAYDWADYEEVFKNIKCPECKSVSDKCKVQSVSSGPVSQERVCVCSDCDCKFVIRGD